MSTTTRRTINFKHVGTKISARKFEDTNKKPTIPIGIKTPLRIGTGNSNLFDMHFQPSDQISDNLKNLIKTNFGERLGRFNYGANLNSLSFDYADISNFENNALVNIREAVEKTMPIVEIDNVEVKSYSKKETSELPDGIAQINISITYNVPKIKVVGAKLIAVIYAGG
jgi:phage baseplate assembly protein W